MTGMDSIGLYDDLFVKSRAFGSGTRARKRSKEEWPRSRRMFGLVLATQK